jgi:hypothetical protein
MIDFVTPILLVYALMNAEDDGLSATPVIVVEINVARVFFSDSNVWHSILFFCEQDCCAFV